MNLTLEEALTSYSPIGVHKRFPRPKVKDISISEIDQYANRNYITSLKYDGQWVYICIDDNAKATVVSRTGNVLEDELKDVEFSGLRCSVLIAECMRGTNWALREGLEGLFYVFDIVVDHNLDVSMEIYRDRESRLSKYSKNFPRELRKVGIVIGEDAPIVYERYVQCGKFEGIVLRNKNATFDSPYYKLKKKVTMDYVVLGFEEGKGKYTGKLGALILGLYREDKLIPVCKVGGGFTDQMRENIYNNQNQYRGKVVEVSGYDLFLSGALRHPNFVRWRVDKDKRDCVYIEL